jgi:hypothetical protein
MGYKSIREIVESAAVTHLGNQGLTGVQIVAGVSAAINTLPIVVATVDSVSDIPEIAQGLGNFRCTLTVMVVTETDEANSASVHRERSEKVMSAFQDEAGLAAVFTTAGDASMYSCDFKSLEDGRGERTFGTSYSYEVKAVLAP